MPKQTEKQGRELDELHREHWTTPTWPNLFLVPTFKKLMLKYLTEVKEANQDDLRPV